MIKKTPANTMSQSLIIFGSLLWLLAASAALVESDTYRYAMAILALIALYYYYWRMPERPRTNWLGWLCMGWGLYVVARFVILYFDTPAHDIGASDWLFAFPLFFPILGIAFGLYEAQSAKIIAAFFAIALIMLAVTTQYAHIAVGETAAIPLIMNNQIHGAVACGLIIIWSCFWLLHYLTEKSAAPHLARFAWVAAPLIILLCLVAIYGAKSKGVWLALGVTLPVIGLLVLGYLRPKHGIVIVACASLLLLAGIYGVRHNLYKTAGPTVNTAISLLEGVRDGQNVGDLVAATIDSVSTPLSADERLQLWYNAGEVIFSAPIFGWGNEWLERWHQTRYSHVQYTLLHNGYLEILVRYGLFGAIILSTILGTFIVSVRRACRAGIIPRAAMHAYMVTIFFFALTILSNSNNRLAIGESLALVSSAFACWCNMRLRTVDIAPEKITAERPRPEPVVTP